MHFYYQTGEFYGDTGGILNKFLLVLIGGGFTLLGVYIKDIFDRRRDEENEVKRIKKLRNYLRITLAHVHFNMDGQFREFENIYKEFEKRLLKPLVLDNSISLTTEVIYKSINYPEYLKIFSLLKDPYGTYLNYIHSMESLNKIVNRYPLIIKTYEDDISLFNQKLNSTSDKFFKLYEIILENQMSLQSDIELKTFWEKLSLEWQNMAQDDIFEHFFLYDNYISKIYDYVLNELEKTKYTSELINIAMEYKSMITSCETVKKNTHYNIIKLRDGLRQVKNHLNVISNELAKSDL